MEREIRVKDIPKSIMDQLLEILDDGVDDYVDNAVSAQWHIGEVYGVALHDFWHVQNSHGKIDSKNDTGLTLKEAWELVTLVG